MSACMMLNHLPAICGLVGAHIRARIRALSHGKIHSAENGRTLMTEMGFFTDTTLCIGCKACEVACKQWNQLPADGFNWSGNSYDNTLRLSATTWRHVKFIEQFSHEAP